MDTSIHEAIRVINESELSEQDKHKCRHFLKRNNNEAPFILDSRNRSKESSDPSQLTIFLGEMAKQQDKLDQQQQQQQQDNTPDGSQNRTPKQNNQYDYSQYQRFQQPDRDNYDNRNRNENEEVNIFKKDDDLNPFMTFDPYIDWNGVKSNLNLHSGWLKRKGDTTNKRVRIGNGVPPGDYTLIDAVPESKKIRIVFSSMIHNYWSSDQRVSINHGDTNDEIRKKIQSAFKFDRHHFSLYQLIDSDSGNKIHNLDYNELDENKTYELIIPWLSKIQKKKEDQLVSASKDHDSGGSGSGSSNKSGGKHDSCKIV